MRADMHKVVVERERGRSTWKNRKWGKRLPFIPDADYEAIKNSLEEEAAAVLAEIAHLEAAPPPLSNKKGARV